MIDYTKLDIRQIGAGYEVFDLLNDKCILSIKMVHERSGTASKVGIYDVRTGAPTLVKFVERKLFNKSHLTEIILNVIDGMTCEICHREWGPVCAACGDEVGDKTFLLFKELQRMADEPASRPQE